MPPYDFEVQYPVRTSLIPPADGGGWSATMDRWHRPWSEPVRQKIAPAATVALIASGLFAPVLNPETQITQNFESRWHYAWSEPVRQKPGLGAHLQQPFTIGTPPIVSYGWNVPQTDLAPRSKPGLLTASQQFVALPSFPPIVSFGWYAPWREPAKPKISLPANSQQFIALPTFPPIVSYGWNVPQTDLAPRNRAGLVSANQQFLAWNTLTPPSEIVTLDKWYAAWREPPKPKVTLAVVNQQFIAFVQAAPFPEAVLESKWHQPWSEPVRFRAPLRTSPAWTGPDFPVPAPVFTNYGWFSPLSLPPDPKPGLLACFQPTFTAPVRLLPNPDVTGVWTSLENKDVFLASARVFAAPLVAITGVIEQKPIGISGVIETPQPDQKAVTSAVVSIRVI